MSYLNIVRNKKGRDRVIKEFISYLSGFGRGRTWVRGHWREFAEHKLVWVRGHWRKGKNGKDLKYTSAA